MSVILTETELGFGFVDEPDGALSVGSVRVTAESGWILVALEDRTRSLPSLVPLRLQLLRDDNGRRVVQIVTPLGQLDLDASRRVVVPALQSEIGRRLVLGVGSRLR